MQSPLSLSAFARWLDTQPADKTYSYIDNNLCAVCQYFDFLGLQYASISSSTWTDKNGQEHDLPSGLDKASNGNDGAMDDIYISGETFGHAAARAHALLVKGIT